MEELLKEVVSPHLADVEVSHGGRDVRSVEQCAAEELLALFLRLHRRSINELVCVLSILDGELIKVGLQIFPETLHVSHVSV